MPFKATDITGMRYGLITVLEQAGRNKQGRVLWKCKCDCGNELIVSGTDLRTGRKTDCGCIPFYNSKNEIGNRYGRLTIIEEMKERQNRCILWKCQCDCGNISIVRGTDLRSGKTKSCGCLEQENRGQSVLINEIGHRYGKLLVIDKIRPNNKTTYWKCQCDCGNIRYTTGDVLRQGRITSCGCTHSIGNTIIQKKLEELSINFKSEIAFTDLVSSKKGHPRFDFGIYDTKNNLLFLLEYQGIQHYENRGEFGKSQREETDDLKKEYCLKNNIPLYEITYLDKNIEECLINILKDYSLKLGR